MNDKSKPLASIYIRRSDLPRLFVVLGLVLLILAILGNLAWQEIHRWQARLQQKETQLQEAGNEAEARHFFWRQLREPVGFELLPGLEPKVIATTCVRIPQNERATASVANAGYTFQYTVVDPDTINALRRSDSFRLVGEDRTSADWTLSDVASYKYYTHKDVFMLFPFLWQNSWDQQDNDYAWNEYMRRYCNNTILR